MINQFRRTANYFLSLLFKDVLSFGRPGCGAPVRTKSGRVRTMIRGNPEIRFQENESVQKTIYNSIRYQSNPDLKAVYHKELGTHTNRPNLERDVRFPDSVLFFFFSVNK